MKRLTVILVVSALLSGGCERTVNNYEMNDSKYYQMKEIPPGDNFGYYYSVALEYLKWGLSRVEEYIPGIILLGTLYQARRLFSNGINLNLNLGSDATLNIIKKSNEAKAAAAAPAED